MSGLLTKAHGSIVTAASMLGQSRVPYLSREELRQTRDRRVRQIVRYAATTVPHYRDLFRAQGLNPADIQTAEHLDQLPLLDKEMIREQPERFVSCSKWGRTAIQFVTSGTTGSPVSVSHDQHSLLGNTGFNQRERDVLKTLLGGQGRWRTAGISYRGGTGDAMREFLRQHRFERSKRGYPALSIEDPVDVMVARLNVRRPDVIISYGSYLELVFRMVAGRAIQLHLPQVVCYRSDTMTDAGKRLIEDAGVGVVSHYNAVEAFKIGFTCEQRTGFHLHEDLTYVKIVDSNGRRLPPGEKGEVIISNLVNRGTVLLNYRLGDVAALSHEPCPCGRTFVMLSDLEGRVEDIIHLPDGTFVHPRLVWKLFKHRTGVLRYQLIQHALDTFELRLTTIDRAAFDRVIADVIADLRHLLGQNAAIDAVYQADFQPYAGAKFRPVLSLLEERD